MDFEKALLVRIRVYGHDAVRQRILQPCSVRKLRVTNRSKGGFLRVHGEHVEPRADRASFLRQAQDDDKLRMS